MGGQETEVIRYIALDIIYSPCTMSKYLRITYSPCTQVSEYPWMAALTTKHGGFCGGALVGDQWLLTAAHCTHGLAVTELEVTTGSLN